MEAMHQHHNLQTVGNNMAMGCYGHQSSVVDNWMFIPQVSWNFVPGSTMEKQPKICPTDMKPSAFKSQALLAHPYMDQYKP